MARNYLHDHDLEFLKDVENSDLEILVEYLIGPPNNRRLTEELSYQPSFSTDYQSCYKEIIHEFQLFGGNTIANIFRGNQGVPYKEILCDVCDRLKVKYNKTQSVETIERALLSKLLSQAIEQMTDEEVKNAASDLGMQGSRHITKAVFLAALQSAIRLGGFKSYQIAVIVANAVAKAILKRGLSLALNAGLTRYMSVLAGPIGWAITAVWTLIDIGGPAYRVTIPACIHVAYLRIKMEAEAITSLCSLGHPNQLDAKFCSQCGENIAS